MGDPEFDEAFIIKGNDESKVREVFSDPKIRQMIQAQPKIRLEVKDSEGWFGPKFPEDVDELHFQVVGVIKDVERLKALFDLFAAVLDQLCRIGSAYKQVPGVTLSDHIVAVIARPGPPLLGVSPRLCTPLFTSTPSQCRS